MAYVPNYCSDLFSQQLISTSLKLFEDMEVNNPRHYQVAVLGDWGITEGLIYENWGKSVFSVDEISGLEGVKSVFGLDFGYTNDPTALFCGLIDTKSRVIWVFDELYQ